MALTSFHNNPSQVIMPVFFPLYLGYFQQHSMLLSELYLALLDIFHIPQVISLLHIYEYFLLIVPLSS